MSVMDSVTFQSNINSGSIVTNGTAYKVKNVTTGTKMFISIANASGSRVLFFEGLGNTAGSYVPLACTNISTGGSGISSSSASDEMWSAPVAGFDYIRCRVTQTSGSLTVTGKLITES